MFGNMDMPKANTDRNVGTQDRHAILLNKYFKENKYQTHLINVLKCHLHDSAKFSFFKISSKNQPPTAGFNFLYDVKIGKTKT
jgi:hypothetical protein